MDRVRKGFKELKCFSLFKKPSNKEEEVVIIGPINNLSSELLSLIFEFFTTQQGRLILSRVNKEFKEAARLCRLRVITPVFYDSVSLIPLFKDAQLETYNYLTRGKNSEYWSDVNHSYFNYHNYYSLSDPAGLSVSSRHQLFNEQLLLFEMVSGLLSSSCMKSIYLSSPEAKKFFDDYIFESNKINQDIKKISSLSSLKKKKKYVQKIKRFNVNDHSPLVYKLIAESALAEEGISGGDHILGEDLIHRLNQGIDRISGFYVSPIVKSFVNPAMFPYVEDLSVFEPSKDLPSNPLEKFERDIFGRRVLRDEIKRFQFLPTYIDHEENGRWKFRGEINNLPRKENSQLYEDLEHLFMKCSPHLESAIYYAQTVAYRPDDHGSNQLLPKDRPDKDPRHVKFPPQWKIDGKSLQVIISIADYELKPGESYEGKFHFDCMPHEQIIATIDVTLDRDDDFEGGGLSFKRGLLFREYHRAGLYPSQRNHVFDINDFASVPLGKVETRKGRVITFPNTHLHRILPSTNASSTKVSKKRSLFIFVVNPKARIISTQEVSVPQTQISFEKAEELRNLLWKERQSYSREPMMMEHSFNQLRYDDVLRPLFVHAACFM